PHVLLDRVELLVLRGVHEVPIDGHLASARARPRRDGDGGRSVLHFPADLDGQRKDVWKLSEKPFSNERLRRLDLLSLPKLRFPERDGVKNLADDSAVHSTIELRH